jgi:predicted nuclease with TOPRIM domain
MMEEFKDACLGLDVRSEEIAVDLRDLPTDYKLAERYMEIDQEIYEMLEWYERVKKERLEMEERLKRTDRDLKFLNNDVQRLKLGEFSRVRHGGSYSQLLQNRRP